MRNTISSLDEKKKNHLLLSDAAVKKQLVNLYEHC